MTAVAEVKPNAAELFKQMAGGRLYREALKEGMTLTAWLMREHPDDEEKDGLDPFERFFKVAGIKTHGDPVRGVRADEFGAFDADESTRALVPEFLQRQWRKVTFRPKGVGAKEALESQARALYLSNDDIPGSMARPYVDDTSPRAFTEIAPAIPLSELVALTTPVDNDTVRSFYFNETAANRRFVRVAEAAEIPRVTIQGLEHTIKLYKYGRVIEASYETLRRQRIDKVAYWMMRVAIQAETDKVAAAMDVLINGDGNANTSATEWDLTTLDTAAVAGTLTLKGWLKFKLKFANPYAITHALVQEDGALQLMLLNVGSANVPLVVVQASSGFGGFTPINPELRDNVRLGITSDAPTLKIVGFDARMALERFTEIGSDIEEIERWTTKQTQTLTMTENEGWGILDANATKLLDINQ